MANIAYIYQPHFKTGMFRVAVKDQLGTDKNYIVVTCSPQFNGVYSYPVSNIQEKKYDTWSNNGTNCICVPIVDCQKLKELNEVTNSEVISRIKKQQNAWYNNNITNRDYEYKGKPEWML